MMMTKNAPPCSRGRPLRPMPRIDASPERVARAMFSPVKPPDLSIRVRKAYQRKPKLDQ